MSRIGSSSGVRVASQPLSNVYTVLLLIAALAMVAAFGVTAYTVQTHYRNGFLGYGEDVERDLQDAERALAEYRSRLDEHDQALERAARAAGEGGAEEDAPDSPTM
jgi:F0F1-type ATP synthase membrane subunit b/b'